MLLREFFEAAGNEAAIIFGRFNPPHKGHKAAWEVAAKSPVWYVGTHKATVGPKDPLPFDVKIECMEAIWPGVKGHIVAETSWLTLASKVYAEHKASVLYCCTDEDWVTKTVIQYNGKEGPHGYYNFPSIEQKPTPRLSSATDLRSAVMLGDRNAFSKAAGVNADLEINGTPFFDLVAKYLLPYADTKSGKSSKASAKLKEVNKAMSIREGEGERLSIEQLANISDKALDDAYHYGRSTPGNTFGWQANLKSAEFAKQVIDSGETEIEIIADAVHEGWNETARAFVQNPGQFDDTEKLMASGKLDAKIAQRERLMNISYDKLPPSEQEKDIVVARAILNALKSVNEAMMPKRNFAGSYKLGPAAHLTGKMKRPAKRGDLVGGAMESISEEQLDELNVTQTLKFIQQAHGDQLYGKLPYWKHPRAVALTGKKIFGNKFNSDAVKTAFLHDVVEDTHIGLNELSKLDFTPQVIEAVGLLTKDKSLTYTQNIEKIINSGNPLAMMVKYADNYENYTGDKSSWDPIKAASSQKKYLKSLNMLGDKLGVKTQVGEAGDTVSPVGGKKGTGPALGGYDMDAMRQATGTMETVKNKSMPRKSKRGSR